MYNSQEAKSDFLLTRSIIVFFFLVLISLVLMLSIKGGLVYAAIKIAPVKAQAIVTDIEEWEDGYTKHRVIYYSYLINEDNTKSGLYAFNYKSKLDERFRSLTVESRINIIHSKWFPQVSFVESRLESRLYDFYLSLACVTLALLCVVFIIWNASVMRKRRKEMNYY